MGAFEDKFLKKRFTKVTTLGSIVDKTSPVVAMADKPITQGASVAEACRHRGNIGMGYTLSAAQAVTAQTDEGAGDYDEWVSPFGKYHGTATISAFAVAGGTGGDASYLRQIAETIETEVDSFGHRMGTKLFGPVGGSVGRIQDLDEGGGNGEIQLTLRSDSFNFAKGMILQASDSTGNGAPANVRSGLGYVYRVVPSADVTGTTTTGAHIFVATSSGSTTSGGPTGWADNDYLFYNGDIAASSDLSNVQVRSLQGWCTSSSSTATYNNVDRSKHEHLSGFRLNSTDYSGLGVIERIDLLCTVGAEEANAMAVDTVALGPRAWNTLRNELKQYGRIDFQKDAKFGFQYITLMQPQGEVKVVCDVHVRSTDIWALSMKKLKIHNFDGVPGLDEGDGKIMNKKATSADYEVRWHAFTSVTVSGEPWQFGRTVAP